MIWDYLVFLIFIVATTFVAVYNRSGPKEKTKADYVFAAGQKISIGAMMLSIARGILGVRSFLGRSVCRNNKSFEFQYLNMELQRRNTLNCTDREEDETATERV